MTLTVHHLQVSQSERVPWLCEELGIPYELVIYKRNPLLSPPELKKLSALGAAPVIFDTSAPYSESKPLTLAESAAVVEYITQRHGGGRLTLPPTHKDYADYIYWWHFSNGNLQASASRQMTIASLQTPSDNPTKARYDARWQTVLKHMDDQLAKGPYLAGEEFTIADIMSMFTLTTMRKFYSYSLVGYDNILAWLKRCAARPGYQKAREKADDGLPPSIDAEPPPVFEALQPAQKKS